MKSPITLFSGIILRSHQSRKTRAFYRKLKVVYTQPRSRGTQHNSGRYRHISLHIDAWSKNCPEDTLVFIVNSLEASLSAIEHFLVVTPTIKFGTLGRFVSVRDPDDRKIILLEEADMSQSIDRELIIPLDDTEITAWITQHPVWVPLYEMSPATEIMALQRTCQIRNLAELADFVTQLSTICLNLDEHIDIEARLNVVVVTIKTPLAATLRSSCISAHDLQLAASVEEIIAEFS